ncbi:phosphoadenosine phosphosulfate reductase [Priestia taiwanensis]|uniref:Adenosine 5'-phosphosulfate reductase n=1 Tax=Priestia taiwanensis TaxID=1347902 RepID=A0A917ASF2_9BACI|nr:phosphoadenylyl-sulfate reductase [Priestia taiwanensis]MBM7364047.1 phosphoadenosine phosphosulfate reductase [Priestia taiwanensis]GGE71192.1 putative phosphoadenosine phosphosulfate reductase [Priestia taiwanensis]
MEGRTILTYNNWVEADVPKFEEENETKGALDVLKWAYDTYKEDIVYACSFGIEGIVLIDLIAQVNDSARIVFLDTGLHFKETYDVIEKVRTRYPSLRIEMKKPALTVEEQKEQYGDELWKHKPGRCCEMRKVIPLQETLSGKTAWISGLRKDQSPTRKYTKYVNRDYRFESLKVCPLVHWTWDEIWEYVRKYDLAYNVLHDQNYPSIGCEMCTLPTTDPNDHRAGRWSGMDKTECGLHRD